MSVTTIDDVERLKRINQALMARVERSMDQQGNAFTLFQTAINLDSRIRQRTEELTQTLRRLEQSNHALSVAKEAAEQANISKTRFLAAASHDVLQPLNAAHLSISALAELQKTDEGKRLARQVERALETMEDLLRTLLDISKLDAGVVRPEITDVALQPLFQSLKSDFSPMATKKRLELRFRPTVAAIRTDRTMYRRVLQNIISNALRYTQDGGVLVGVRRRQNVVVVEVVDTGSGIPADQYDAVFEEFHRGVNVRDLERGNGGLGLGLAIVKRMVNALGHEIAFTSKVGRGTVFRVAAPLASWREPESAQSGETGATAPRGYGLYGARVLLAENDDTVREALITLLERWNCSVRSAANMEDALALLGDTAWVPDIVIADQHLDHGDLGTVTIDETRKVLMRHVPALVITADPSESLARAARELGIEVMRKPAKPAELRALMAHLLA